MARVLKQPGWRWWWGVGVCLALLAAPAWAQDTTDVYPGAVICGGWTVPDTVPAGTIYRCDARGPNDARRVAGVVGYVRVLAKPAPPPPVDTTPPPPAPAAWVSETFPYRTTAELFASSLYSATEDMNRAQISMTAGGDMRYDFPARPGICTDYTIGRNLRFPETVPEVWVEVTVVFAANFRTQAAGCEGKSNPDYKFFFGRVPTTSRFGLQVGTYGGSWTFGVPGQETAFQAPGASVVWDGQPHTFRFHFAVGSAGGATFWLDGKEIAVVSATVSRTGIYGLALGRNMNQGPDVATSITWQRIIVYQVDPGWN